MLVLERGKKNQKPNTFCVRSGRQFKKCIVHFRIGQLPLWKQKNKYEIQLCLLKDSDRVPHQRGAGILCQLKGLPPNIRQLKFTFRGKGNRTLVGVPWEDKRETHWFKQSAPQIRVGSETDNAQSSTLTPSKEKLSQGHSSQQAGLLKRGGKGAVTITISTSELGLLQHTVDLQAWPLAWKAFLFLSLAPLAFFLPPILVSGFSSFPVC